MKTIGMIGGLSWESTALYYKIVNELVRRQLGGVNSARVIINSLNYQTFVNLKNEGNWEEIAALLSRSAQELEQAGADFIALCCNTLHKVAPEIITSISVPFIHIADAAGIELNREKITKVGLLGTQFTMEDGFYSEHLMSNFNIEVIIPELEMRKEVDRVISNELSAGKISRESKAPLLKAMQGLDQQGAQAILLGCTELGILIQSEDFHRPVFDTTILHAQEIVSIALSSS